MQNAPATDRPAATSSSISVHAVAIARGLRRSGRVGDLRATMSGNTDESDTERWLTMPAAGDQFYFLRRDGRELRRGDDFVSAVENFRLAAVSAMPPPID